MRTVLCLLLGLIAAGAALIGTTMPLALPAQAAKDRVYYDQFKVAASYVAKNGEIPAGDVLRALAARTTDPSIWASLSTTPIDCDPSFKMAPADTLVLSFWRGEWSECFAYPSGKTTLPMTVHAYLLSGLAIDFAIYWLVAIGAAWAAIRLRPQRQA